jgi:cytochrome P450
MTQQAMTAGQLGGPEASLRALLSAQGRANPFPHYQELLRRGPICVLPDPIDRFDVVVQGYDAVQQAMKSPALHVMTSDYPDRRGAQRWRAHTSLRTLVKSVFFTEGTDHTRVRRLFSQVFTARRIAALEPAIERIIERRLDRMAELGTGGRPVDLVAEFALPVPSDVISELLGVPEGDRDFFPGRVRNFGAILDLGVGIWRYQQAADTAADELIGYFTELAAKRRVEPRDDLVSALVHGDGQLTDEELTVNLLTLYNGGFVTTTHLIGNGLVLLLEHPDVIPRVLDDPEYTAGALEEILRFEPPTHFSIRWAHEETEIAGIRVPRDSRVLILFAAANRDPAVYPDPDVFDPTRQSPAKHVSFGLGMHYCLGAALSRLEGQRALPMLLRRFPNLALAGDPGDRQTLMLRGYPSLPVTL